MGARHEGGDAVQGQRPAPSKSGVAIKEGAIQPHLPFVLVPKPKPRAKAAKRVREEEEGAE